MLTLLGVGIGSAQLMSDNAEPPKQEETKPEMPEVTEEPEEPEEPEKIEEPEETVPAEEPTVGTVTKVENVVPPSEQEEKIEPKKKKNSNY
ncbi:hypothetical protein B481_1139 [Planococcus halocryophilus Or1]|nr:hypothetical protein B481_1139 [Planococcus halocryophilus Or1]